MTEFIVGKRYRDGSVTALCVHNTQGQFKTAVLEHNDGSVSTITPGGDWSEDWEQVVEYVEKAYVAIVYEYSLSPGVYYSDMVSEEDFKNLYKTDKNIKVVYSEVVNVKFEREE